MRFSVLASPLQVLPDPSAFGIADSWGVPAALLFAVALMGYLLWRAEKRADECEADKDEAQARYDAILAKYEGVLLEDLRRYEERDRTLEIIAKSKGA